MCTSCDTPFQQLNCPSCQASNVWPKGDYCEGCKVACHSCKRDFVQLKCPHCFASNDMVGEYVPGMIVTCSACHELFQQITCQRCYRSNVWKQANLKPLVKSACHGCSAPIQIDPKCTESC